MSEEVTRKSSFAKAFFATGEGGEDITNAEGTESNGGAEGFDDEEVLEQYRIMAQHEASARVKESIGFDKEEYQERRRKHEEEFKQMDYRAKLKITMAEPRLSPPSAGPGGLPKPEEPPLPPAVPNTKFVKQRGKRVPELCIGTPVGRGSGIIPEDEHVVKCLGPCRNGALRVKIGATLVSCPECHTVSPASSTRR